MIGKQIYERVGTNMIINWDKYLLGCLAHSLKLFAPPQTCVLQWLNCCPCPTTRCCLTNWVTPKGSKKTCLLPIKRFIFCIIMKFIVFIFISISEVTSSEKWAYINCGNGYPCPVGRVIRSKYDFNSQYTSQVHNTIQQSNAAFDS